MHFFSEEDNDVAKPSNAHHDMLVVLHFEISWMAHKVVPIAHSLTSDADNMMVAVEVASKTNGAVRALDYSTLSLRRRPVGLYCTCGTIIGTCAFTISSSIG